MRAIVVLVLLTIGIALSVYFGNKGAKDASRFSIICMVIAAVLAFLGPYIVDFMDSMDKKVEIENIDNSTPAHEHKKYYEEKENIIEATCLDEGSYELVSYCECGVELRRETITIDALGHKYIKKVTKPSCDESGYTTYICSRCKDSYVDDSTEALGHSYVNEICSRCGSAGPEYETLIVSQVNELVNMGNYDEALDLISEALELIDSESLKNLQENIRIIAEEVASTAKYTAKTVEFIPYSGSIDSSDETDIYYLTTSINGYYRFDLSNMINGFKVKLYVYDSNGNEVKGNSGYGNDEGMTCLLDKDETYSIKVMSYLGTGNYMLTVGQQKESIDITHKETIYDSIEYTEQCNEYTFTPPISGVYRFDLSNMINGFRVKLHIYDDLGYEERGYSGLENTEGVTVALEKGTTYTIKIGQYSNLGSYEMTIGKQQAIQNITGERTFSGEITYTDQENEYVYTPSSSGEYNFTLQNMVSGFKIKFYIYDSMGYEVRGYSGVENGSVITADLKAKENYTIHLIQYSSSGSYKVRISK